MPTPTYDLIASNVLSSSVNSVTFSSIPATYRDLIVVTEVRSDVNNNRFRLQFNNDTNSNYPYVAMTGDGSTATSFTFTVNGLWAGQILNTQFESRIFQIMDYSATNKHKTVLSRGNSTTVYASAARWANTAAINEIDFILLDGGNFVSGSTFYLYGIVG